MANGLLDYIQDFDINKALGVQYGLPKGMLSPEIESQMGVGGTVTGIGNVIEGIQQGAGTPENIFRFLTGQKAGRQNVIDTAAKNYLSQLNIAKLQGDIAQDPYKLSKLKFEVEQAPYQLEDIKNKAFDSSIRSQAIKLKLKQLQDSGDVNSLVQFSENPTEYFKAEREADPRFRKQTAFTVAEENIAKSMGLDPKNPKSWTQTQQDAFTYIITRPNQESINNLRTEERKEQLNNPNYTPSNEMSNMEALNAYRKGNLSLSNVKQTEAFTETSTNKSPYRKNKLNDNTYVDWFGNEYNQQQWDDLGIEFQNANKTHLDQKQQFEKQNLAEKEAKGSGQEQRYLFTTISEANKVIRELLNDPQAIKDMQSMGGKFLQNIRAGKYGITSNPQDAANLLSLIQNKQFIQEIQTMRTNNETGGAVGNVSDKEVQLFINAAAALQNTSSPKALYKQLTDLHKKGEKILESEATKYKRFYGKNYYDNFELQKWLDETLNHDFLNYEDAIKAQGQFQYDTKKTNESGISRASSLVKKHKEMRQGNQ